MVSMESILNSKKFAESKMELPVALGRTITNEVFMFDLAKMPHLLVAGATGQGKSVGLNAVITSLLYKKHPAELKLVMVDPKMVEFSIYAPIIKHFLAKMPDETDAIITDTTKVIHTLKSLCIEMDNRYELLKNANVRSVIEYNNMFKDRKLNPEKGHRYLPYIVVVIDEFGDLIMTAGKDIEMPIARIAQKARAVGIHMIIATQRPTTNIITGTIKANFPARMAFRVSSMIDSRTILDRPGANQLIGRGDLLFLSGSDPVRVQCAFVDTPEVNAICQYISRQQGYTEAYPLPEYVDENEGGPVDGGVEMGKFDPMFAEAARLVVVNQSGSTSLIQRKFAIGYNRAGRLMDQLEATGIVGKADGSKPRPVLVTDEVQLDRILETYNLL
jgi:S-DNA-T family DNA segregation ATPase FtsK/SpoIIIE